MLRLTRGFTKGYGIPKLFPSVIPTEAGATKGRGPQRARFLAGWGGGSDGEWRDPDTLSRTMLYQGVLTRTHIPYLHANRHFGNQLDSAFIAGVLIYSTPERSQPSLPQCIPRG